MTVSNEPVRSAFVLILSGWWLWELYKVQLGLASRYWRKTSATILSATVDEQSDAEGGSSSYTAKVQYRYRVGTRWFESRRLSYRPVHSYDIGKTAGLLRGMRRGSEVPVHYDPRHPRRSVLLPGVDWGNGLMILFLTGALAYLLGQSFG
ncbi:MAG: DUF3592 domain-containing protein [Lysobacterales bacterium]